MKVYGSMSVALLLLAGTAQAVTTVSPLNDKGWQQVQQSLVGSVGPVNEGVAGVQGQSPEVAGLAEDTLPPGLNVVPDFTLVQPEHPAASRPRGGDVAAGQRARDLVEGVGDAAGWGTDHHWSTDPRKYSDVGFVNASSRVDFSAFDDVGWMTTPLPTAGETSIMEIVILPALAAVAVIMAVALFVRRLRKRKPVEPVQHLLQV